MRPGVVQRCTTNACKDSPPTDQPHTTLFFPGWSSAMQDVWMRTALELSTGSFVDRGYDCHHFRRDAQPPHSHSPTTATATAIATATATATATVTATATATAMATATAAATATAYLGLAGVGSDHHNVGVRRGEPGQRRGLELRVVIGAERRGRVGQPVEQVLNHVNRAWMSHVWMHISDCKHRSASDTHGHWECAYGTRGRYKELRIT